jgi:hypothetical protein
LRRLEPPLFPALKVGKRWAEEQYR